MTDIQLYLTVGIPSLLVVLSWINNNYRFTALERRLHAVEKRLDRHDTQLEEIKAAVHQDALEIMRQMTALHERVTRLETRQG